MRVNHANGRTARRRLAAACLSVTMIISSMLGISAGLAQPANASTQSSVDLAKANLHKGACSKNSLGGKGFETSCHGNGGYPEYWCNDFAKWVWFHAGVHDTQYLGNVGTFYTYGRRFHTLSKKPAVDDAVVFSYSGHAQHVAIVTAVGRGTIETISGDWEGQPGSERHFAGTSHVIANTPPYNSAVGSTSPIMGNLTLSGYVAPVRH